MSRNDFIKLGHIDTSAATQNFVKLLEDNKKEAMERYDYYQSLVNKEQ